MVFGSLGGLEREINKNPEAAWTYVKEAIEQQREATKLAPDNPIYMEKLLAHQSYLADILDQLGLNDEATKMRQDAEKTKDKLEAVNAEDFKSPDSFGKKHS